METFEWWQIVLGILAILMPVALGIFGRGFSRWADRLDEIAASVDRRLAGMQSENRTQWERLTTRISSHESSLHDLHIVFERRLTALETYVRNGNRE